MTSASRVDIRPLWAGFPTGVAVVTALAADGRPWGMTCTSLCSVSLDPPLLLVCLRCGSPTLEAIQSTGGFAVNLLHDRARPVSDLFASGVPDRFDRVSWLVGPGMAGPRLVDAAHTVADCALAEDRTVGDHNVVMGAVLAVTRLTSRRPLMYGLRRYSSWPEPAADADAGPFPRGLSQAFEGLG
ncbi:NADH-FMN oxidoreductase RutF, flavin reductase (DIM6/NTAB) family [Actinomadura meyerae]|uniref:NADH-FMN oxidoreductase RutF, flavin reductase (DIM6/NTAB) family n=1 Tax=Actinomadura meyerae TaxID=240840 RepID=A0A239GKU5_9ACTN|nr:flavin reductase family protein [Actinomadura meyerae]SNS68684.1 NADH-FMN oxidoreductase RutF, flavin reductase (DIM6/NTAB) family [Actinomadura meyerae]